MVDEGERLRRRAAGLIREVCADRTGLEPIVVEAGCGARSQLDHPAHARIVGVDLSRTQLQRNQVARWRLQGDVARLPLASGCADVAVSWDVLEHVARPDAALAELARVIRPGGLIVLGLPNILSAKGIVTRLTPWRVHVWVYRYLLGDPTAGTGASDQFPTTMGLELRRAGLRKLAAALGLEIVVLESYEGPVPRHFRRRHRLGDVALTLAGWVSRGASLGRYDANASDLVVVLRRPVSS